MSVGSVMTYYTAVDGSEPTSQSIFIWWEEGAAGKLGTIYFNNQIETKEKTKVEGNQLPLSKITDVFSGKQQPIFKADSLSSIPSDQCFSFGSKVLPLHLQADSASVRQSWIGGVKDVFSKSQATKKGATVTTTTATATANSTNAGTTTGETNGANTNDAADPIAVMTAGQKFVAVTGVNPSVKHDVFVWYERESSKFGVLYQTPSVAEGEQPRPHDESTAVALHRVSDVYLGKRAPELASDATSGIPSNQCFTIVSKERSLHLIAPNESVRASYIAGIKEVFAQMKVAKGDKATITTTTVPAPAPVAAATESEAPVAEAAPVVAAAAVAPTESAPVESTSSAAVVPVSSSPPNVLSDGRMYRSLSTGPDGSVTASPIFLWHDPSDGKLGTLYHSSTEGDKTKLPGRSMPVSKIKDVFLGKQTNEFKSDYAKDISSKECFSLMLNKDKGEGLHLVATDEQTRNATLATIKGFWSAPKKAKTEESAAPAAAAPVQEQAPAVAAVAAPVEEAKQQPEETKESEEAKVVAAAAVTGLAIDAGAASSSTPVVDALSPVSPRSQSTAARVAAEVAEDPVGNVAAMKAGSPFKAHVITPGQTTPPAPVDVYVFFAEEKEDGILGSIYYNVGSDANLTKSPERQLQLATTRDVFVGKHAWRKVGVTPPDFPSSRGLSLVAGNLSLHLESSDDLTRARWATGVRNIFESAHKKASSTSPLIKGGEFTQHSIIDGQLVSKPIFLFYERHVEKLGTIYWCEVGKREMIVGQSIPLHKVSDVFLGKHATYRDAVGASNIRTSNAFSIVSKATSLHLEAGTPEQRTTTIEDLRNVFASSGKRVDEAKNGKVISPRPGSPLIPVIATPIGDGLDFEQWNLDVTGKVTSQRIVHVWFEHIPAGTIGTLFWSEGAGNRVKVNGQSLPLRDITDVFVGKYVDEFKHSDASDLAQDRCISLRSQRNPNLNLNLVASTAQAQRRWVRGLRRAFSENPETVIETRGVQPGQTPVEAITSPRSARSIQAKLSALVEGHQITSVGAQGQTCRVTLWLERDEGRAGTLYWSEHRDNKVPSQSIAIHTVADVFVGKKTPILRQDCFKSIPSNTAFSVSSKTRRLDAYAQSEAERKKFLDQLAAAIHAAGTPVREYQHGKPGAKSSGAGASVNPIVSNQIVRSQLTFIEEGRPVLLHHTAGAEPTPIFLWYEPQHGKQGALFWSGVSSGSQPTKTKVPKQSMLLQHISDVLMARQTDILKASPSLTLKGENCFSLLTANGPRLDLQVSSKVERDEWLRSLRTIFGAAQKKIVEGSGVPHARKLQVGTIVDSWWGRGRVLEETRKDGITKVDIDGTIVFFNGESLKPVPVLYTPYGSGVPPIRDVPRADGIRRVDLVWGAKAYLNAESISLTPYATVPGASKTGGLQTRDQSIAFLVQGQSFNHVAMAKKTPIFVCLNATATPASPQGALEYYIGTSKNSSAPFGTIPLSNLTDLLLGAQTATLKQLNASDATVLSLLTRDGATLDLEALSEVARRDFVYALFNLLQTSGRKVTQQRGSEAPFSATGPSNFATKISFGQKAQPLPSLDVSRASLAKGTNFRLIVVKPSGERIEGDVIVYLQPEQGTLYWTQVPNLAPTDSIQIMELKHIRDVYYNKKTPLFQEVAFQSYTSEQCFSLGSKDKTQWNLIASTKDVRDTFFFALQSTLSAGPSTYTQPLAPNAVTRGSTFTLWTGEGEELKSETIFLFHEKDDTKYGSLYWNAVESDRTLDASRTLSLSAIRDVYLGRNTATMKSAGLNDVPKEVLFSLVAPSSSSSSSAAPTALNLQARDAAHRTEFIENLKIFWKTTTTSSIKNAPVPEAAGAAAAVAGVAAVATTPVAAVAVASPEPVSDVAPLSGEFRSALVSTKQRSLHVAPLPAVQLLQGGSKFQTNLAGEQDVFYVGGNGVDAPFGAIYYAPIGSRALVDENQIAVHRLEQIKVTSNAIVLVTATQELELSSSDSSLLAAWLSGLYYILSVSGLRITSSEAGVFNINDPAGLERQPQTPTLPAAVVTAGIKGEGVVLGQMRVWVEQAALVYAPASGEKVFPVDASQVFALSSINRVQTGSRAVTLSSGDRTLALEAVSQSALSFFLAGLTEVLSENGVTVKVDRNANQSEVERVYVAVKSVPAVVVDGAADAAAIAPPASPGSDADAIAQITKDGVLATAYTTKKGQLLHKALTLWVGQDATSAAATLYYGAADDSHALARTVDDDTSEVELSDIATIEVGKSSTTLQSLPDADVPSNQCVAITGASNLELVFDSAVNAKAFVQVIQNAKAQ